jgi:hypothetical protein
VFWRAVLGFLAHGESTATILEEFPGVSEDDLRAVIAFAAARPRSATRPSTSLLNLRVAGQLGCLCLAREPTGSTS